MNCKREVESGTSVSGSNRVEGMNPGQNKLLKSFGFRRLLRLKNQLRPNVFRTYI